MNIGKGAPVYKNVCGPYIQSLRKDIYKEYAEKLVEMGVAYRCDCTKERLEEERKERLEEERKERESKGMIGGGYSGYCKDRNLQKRCSTCYKTSYAKRC